MLKVMATSGVIRPYSPIKLARLSRTLLDWGIGFAGGIGALATRSPSDVGLIDELGELTWSDIDDRSTRLAHGLKEIGVCAGDSVALLCRNHRYFVDASAALSKLGADILYLNTAFSAPQLGEVCEREEPAAIIYDDEFTELIDKSGIEVERVIAWHDGEPADIPLVRVDDDDFGMRLRAFVVKEGDVDEDTLKTHVKDTLANYKVPREIIFIDELPRNPTGKILKKDLKEYDEDGHPGEGSSDSSGSDPDADADSGADSGSAEAEPEKQAQD